MEKVVYGFDVKTAIYNGTLTLDDSDRAPVTGDWLIPAHYTEVEPPPAKEGFNIVWKGNAWAYEEIPQPPEPPVPPPPTPEEKIAALDAEYSSEKATLCQEYTDAEIHNDTATMDAIVQEMADLDDWYDTEYEKIIHGEEKR